MKSNLKRMIELVDEVFNVKNDPDQLDIDEEVMRRLLEIHPASVSEIADDNGPITWLIIFPTLDDLIKKFVRKEITEKELFYKTIPKADYQCIYLCSVVTLPEFRKRGLTIDMTLRAIEQIREDHYITSLCVWAFTHEGNYMAEKLSEITSLPLIKRI